MCVCVWARAHVCVCVCVCMHVCVCVGGGAYVYTSHSNVEEGVRNLVFGLHSHITSNRHIVHCAEKFYKISKLKASD